MIAATNTGDSLNHLNDYPGALEWMQRGLALARTAGGPGAMGVALLQTAFLAGDIWSVILPNAMVLALMVALLGYASRAVTHKRIG